MGWLDTMLDLTSVALDVANYSKINQLQKMAGQQQQHAMMNATAQAIINALRQEIFRYRQAAEEILAKESESPLLAAGGMKILEINLNESPITPELFLDLNDKTYVASTISLIRSNSLRLMNSLASREQTMVNDMIQYSKKQADYSYYLENREKAYLLLSVQETVERLKGRNTLLARSGLAFGFLILSLIVFRLLISNFNGGSALFIFLLLFLPATYGLYKFIDRKTFEQAQKTINALEGELDIRLLQQIDKLVGGSVDRARETERQARMEVEEFFTGRISVVVEPVALPVVTPAALQPEEETLPESVPVRPLFCANCGKKVAEGGDFCVWCGERLIL